MNAVEAGSDKASWWRRWWAQLAAFEATMEYSSTDHLLDRIEHLEQDVLAMRTDLDAEKARRPTWQQ